MVPEWLGRDIRVMDKMDDIIRENRGHKIMSLSKMNFIIEYYITKQM